MICVEIGVHTESERKFVLRKKFARILKVMEASNQKKWTELEIH